MYYTEIWISKVQKISKLYEVEKSEAELPLQKIGGIFFYISRDYLYSLNCCSHPPSPKAATPSFIITTIIYV